MPPQLGTGHLNPQTKKAQGCLRQDGLCQGEGAVHRQVWQYARKNVHKNHASTVSANRSRRLDVLLLAQRQHLAANESGQARPRQQSDHQDHIEDIRPHQRHQDDDGEEKRKRLHELRAAHQQVVDLSAAVPEVRPINVPTHVAMATAARPTLIDTRAP